jgi:hypothetical protein
MKYLRDVPGGTDSASRRRIRISGIVPIREGAHGDDAHGDDSRQCRRSRAKTSTHAPANERMGRDAAPRIDVDAEASCLDSR